MIDSIDERIRLSREIGLTSIAPSLEGFEDRTYVVTGAGVGIGRCLTEAIVSFGGHVIAIDIQRDELSKLRKKLGSENVAPLACDFRKPFSSRFKAALAEVCDQSPPVVGYVMNAAIQKKGPWNRSTGPTTTPVEELNAVINVNALRHLELAQILYPRLQDSGEGRAVVTSTAVVGRQGQPNMMEYATSKTMLLEGIGYFIHAYPSVATNGYIVSPAQTFLRADYKNEPLYANPMPEDVTEIPSRLVAPQLRSEHQNKMFVIVDKRHPAQTPSGFTYDANERTENGFLFDIRIRAPLNKGAGTEGDPFVLNYDTWINRQLTGHGPVPPVNENVFIRDVFGRPPQYIRKYRELLRPQS